MHRDKPKGVPIKWDAVVVGSGFGGAVAAARLAQAGLSVAVIERGRRWLPGEFSRDVDDLTSGWSWQLGGGLYDVRWLDQMISVQGAGWGGGSLIYANVFARPPQDIFQHEAWPTGYSRRELDPYFALAAHMLEVAPVSADPATGHFPRRTLAMEALVTQMGRRAGTVRPNLAVRFRDQPDLESPNIHGVPQRGCTFTGECIVGCNQGAKNTLDLNYLAVAEQHGALAILGAEVTGIAPGDGQWTVSYQSVGRHDTARRESEDPIITDIIAGQVFLAAGAVGTTELLLRARDVHKTMPHLPDSLGAGFSGNGDFLSFIRGGAEDLEPSHGPTITTTTIVDAPERGDHVWFQVQDGAYPVVLARLAARFDPVQRIRARVSIKPPHPRAVLALLMMGRDASAGRLVLDHNGEASLRWANRENRWLYRSEARIAGSLARSLGARGWHAPSWTWLRKAVTVHNLGGVPMGPDGVVDEFGELHSYPGLFVVDGAALPTATGVNPSATILAVAERNLEHAIRRRSGQNSWRAPEWAAVRSTPVPEDDAFAMMRERYVRVLGDGIMFYEIMRGTATKSGIPSTTRRGRRVTLTLSADLPGLHGFLEDPEHRLAVAGTLQVDGVFDHLPVAGTLALFGSSAAMRYELTGTDPDGSSWSVTGTKRRRLGPLSALFDLTTLNLVVVRSGPATGTPADGFAAVLRIGPKALARLALSLRGQGFTRSRRFLAVAHFLAFFARGAVLGAVPPKR